MKWLSVSVLMSVLLLTGCGEEALSLPEEKGSYALVSHLKEPSLAFLNLKNYKIEMAEPLASAWGAQVELDHNRIAALADGSNEIVILHLEDGSMNSLTELSEKADAIVYVPEMKAIAVASEASSDLQLIDEHSGEVVQTISLEGPPSDMIVADSGQLFVLSAAQEKVYNVDVAQGVVHTAFTVSGRPSGMFYDGELLWIGGHGPTGELNQSIFGFRPDSGKLETEVEVGLMPIAMAGNSGEDSFYVLCHGDHKLYKMNGGAAISSIEVGQNPNYIYEHDDHLLVSNFDSDTLTVINKEPFSVADEVAVGSGPYAISSGEIK